jgi:hypothetical protein
MSIGTILLIILVIILLGGFSGFGGGPFYGTGRPRLAQASQKTRRHKDSGPLRGASFLERDRKELFAGLVLDDQGQAGMVIPTPFLKLTNCSKRKFERRLVVGQCRPARILFL